MQPQTYLYEILIRGTPEGTISGAHVVYMDRYVTDDGQVIADKPSQAAGIDISQIKEILGDELGEALTQLPQALAEKEAAESAKNTAIETLTKVLADVQEILSKLK